MHQKPMIFNLKPSTLWAKNSNFHIRIFFKYMFLEPSRGPLPIATMISEGCFQKFFDRKSEPCSRNQKFRGKSEKSRDEKQNLRFPCIQWERNEIFFFVPTVYKGNANFVFRPWKNHWNYPKIWPFLSQKNRKN